MKKIALFALCVGFFAAKAQDAPAEKRLSKIIYKQKNDLQVWPNPAKDHVRVRINDDWLTTLEVTDQTGNRLLQQPMARDGKVDVSKLPPGVYILSARGTLRSYSKKFLIAK